MTVSPFCFTTPSRPPRASSPLPMEPQRPGFHPSRSITVPETGRPAATFMQHLQISLLSIKVGTRVLSCRLGWAIAKPNMARGKCWASLRSTQPATCLHLLRSNPLPFPLFVSGPFGARRLRSRPDQPGFQTGGLFPRHSLPFLVNGFAPHTFMERIQKREAPQVRTLSGFVDDFRKGHRRAPDHPCFQRMFSAYSREMWLRACIIPRESRPEHPRWTQEQEHRECPEMASKLQTVHHRRGPRLLFKLREGAKGFHWPPKDSKAEDRSPRPFHDAWRPY